MEWKSICIVGACKDAAAHLPDVLANLDTIASWWKETKIVIFENDSSDQTSDMLHAWVAERGGSREIVQEPGLHARITERTDRLAYIRNRLLHYVPPTFDYVFMVDMDDVFASPVRKESFDSCFEMRTWDVMTANGVECYYDIWALRIPGFIEFDCWTLGRSLVSKGYSKKDAEWSAIEMYKEYMYKLNHTIVVHSAFNTGALYKVNAIKPCCRFAGTANGAITCEHIPFQTCLRSHGARILFNPDFKL
jgi:hypothetical protein